METPKDQIPTFDSLPSYVADLAARVERMEQKLDTILNLMKPETEDHTMLTIQEASELIGKKVGTIYGLTCQHAIPFCKQGNKLYFFKDELLQWIRDGGRREVDSLSEKSHEVYQHHLEMLRESKHNRTSKEP